MTTQATLPLFSEAEADQQPWWFVYLCRNAAEWQASLEHFTARYGRPTRALVSVQCPDWLQASVQAQVPVVEARPDVRPFEVWLQS